MNVKDLIKICDEKITEYQRQLDKDGQNDKIIKELTILEKIKALLESQGEHIFFKIDMESSLKILNKLVEKDKILTVYAELISPSKYVSQNDERDAE